MSDFSPKNGDNSEVFLSPERSNSQPWEPQRRRLVVSRSMSSSWRRSVDERKMPRRLLDINENEAFVASDCSLAGTANLVSFRTVTDEYKFWDNFFQVISTIHDDLQPKFRRRVQSTELKGGGAIFWDFYTGRESYSSALDKAINRVESDWSFSWEATRNLWKLAQRVIEQRRSDLKPSEPSYHKQLHAYNRWILLGKTLADKRPGNPAVGVLMTYIVTALSTIFREDLSLRKRPILDCIRFMMAIVVRIIKYFLIAFVLFFALTACAHVILQFLPPRPPKK